MIRQYAKKKKKIQKYQNPPVKFKENVDFFKSYDTLLI